METEDHTIKLGKEYLFKDFMPKSDIPGDMFDKIRQEMRTREFMPSVLIHVKDNTVLKFDPAIIVSKTHQDDSTITVLPYDEWLKTEEILFSNEYDCNRFKRSTNLERLCKKVCEHKNYSFIGRLNGADGFDHVMKYSFVSLSPDAEFILGTRKEITQSLEHDIITGGLNREGLVRELTMKFQAIKGGQYSVLCFNIKGLRVINELYGNETGDRILQHFYTNIVESDLYPVSYARFESDNFICLVRHDYFDTEIIRRLSCQEYISGDQKIVYRSACGIFTVDDPSILPIDACKHAKLALSFIQDPYITPWKKYEPEMLKSVISDSEMLAQIDEAMERQEFIPYFQPVVDVQTGRIVMAEALVRWKSAKHGMMSPGLFIPVLERHGGLSRVDQLMEQKVFRLQRERILSGQPVVPIDLNLSWVDFADTKLIKQLQEHILDPSVPTDLIRFEITESAFDEIAENRVDVLSFFQQNDVKLLVDDFGQGYSFGTMKNIDFHIIKLDKSLIDKIGQSRKMDLIVETFISIFHNLNAKVVAEGVEQKEQVEFLQKAGCDYIQGFYFYRPMDEESFIALLEKQNAEVENAG